MATTEPDKGRSVKRQMQFACLLLPLAMMLPKAIDAYLHCDQTVDFFTADLAASVALILAGILLLIIDRIYSKCGPRGGGSATRRLIYVIFQLIVLLAIFATGCFCFVGNVASAVNNGGAAEATSSDSVQGFLNAAWRMDPFDVCNANDQGRIVEVFRQQPEVFRSTHRAAALVESILALLWAAVAVGLPCVYVTLWQRTCDELNEMKEDDGQDLEEAGGSEQNENVKINCVVVDVARLCCCVAFFTMLFANCHCQCCKRSAS